MMLPKTMNKLKPLGATGAPAKKKGLSFSPLLVLAIAAFIHLVTGFSITVSVILGVIVSIGIMIRNAAKQQSNLPPLPSNENSAENTETSFEPLSERPLNRNSNQPEPIQSLEQSEARLPDLNASHDWGRENSVPAPAPIRAKERIVVPKFERPPIVRLSQSLPKRQTPQHPSSLQSQAQSRMPTHRRQPINIPNLQNINTLHQAIIATAILGPCKANENASSGK
jgi:hypothetical protein